MKMTKKHKEPPSLAQNGHMANFAAKRAKTTRNYGLKSFHDIQRFVAIATYVEFLRKVSLQLLFVMSF